MTETSHISRHKIHIVQELTALVALFIVLCLFRSRVFDSFSTHFIGGAEYDSGLYLWLVRTNLQNLNEWLRYIINDPFSYLLIDREGSPPFEFWFNTRAFYPYGMTLAWSDNFLLPSLAIGGLMKAGLAFASSWNTIILLASLLNGYATYHLVVRLTGNYLASLLAGIAFMTWPWFGEHSGHPQLQFAFFLPLTISATFRFVNLCKLHSALLLLLIVLCALLTSVYYAVFCGLICGLLLIVILILSPKTITPKHLKFSVFAILIAVPFYYPFTYPYLEVAKAFGERRLYEPYAFSATGLSYLSAPIYSWLYGGVTSHLSNGEGHLFPGVALLIIGGCSILFPGKFVKPTKISVALLVSVIATLIAATYTSSASTITGSWIHYLAALLAWGTLILTFLYLRENRSSTVHIKIIVIAFTIFFLIISLGPLGNIAKDEPTLGPFAALFLYTPGLGAIRAIARAGVVVTLGLSILLALTFNKFPKTNHRIAGLKLLLIVFILAENFNVIFPLEMEPKRPEIFTLLDEISGKDDVVFVFPYFSELRKKDFQIEKWSQFARLNVNYMNWLSFSPVKLVNGYSGQLTWFMREFPRKIVNFPDERSITALSYITNLKYIVVIPRLIANFNIDDFRSKLQTLKGELVVRAEDPEGNLLLSLEHTSEIKEGSLILAPPDRGLKSKLLLNVRGSLVPGASPSKLNLVDAETSALLNSIEVPHDGEFKEVQLTPPSVNEHVRARQFKLIKETPTGNESDSAERLRIFVRNPTFEVY